MGKEKIQIGDGKTPNRYWVSTTNDFYITKKRRDGFSSDWASGKMKFKVKGETSKPFNTYQEALDYANHIIVTQVGETPTEDGVNGVFIEDRISGQVFEHTLSAMRIKGLLKGWKVKPTEHEDLEFTRKAKLRKVV